MGTKVYKPLADQEPAPFAEAAPLKPAKPRVTIETAVEAYMADARSRELRPSTISKHETTFRKQFLVWTRSQGLKYLDEIDLDALLTFRSTWKDEGISKQKKQEPVDRFFPGMHQAQLR